MILLTILSISLLQVGIYYALDRTRFYHLKGFALLLFLLGYIFVMPQVIYPTPVGNGKCGMPILGITIAIWFVGGLSCAITYLIYSIVTRRKIKSPSDHEV